MKKALLSLFGVVLFRLIVPAQTVGIGDVNFTPNYLLQIHRNAASGVVFQLTNTTTGLTSIDGFQMNLNGTAVELNNRENDDMRFFTNNAERMTVEANGNVGIGTATPGYKLDIQGGDLGVGTLYGVYAMYAALGSFDTRSTNPPPSTYSKGLISEFKGNAANGLNDGGNYNSVLSNRAWGSGTDWSGGGVAQLAFTENGNFWMRYGTAAWGAWKRLLTNLDISGTTNYVAKFTGANTIGNSQIFDNGTNVGVGTAAPVYKIHAAGDIYANGGWFRVSGGNGLYWESYGPGWYVQDGTWLRTYSNASIWANTGTIATNGSFSAGYGGAAGPAGGAIFSNNVAIGNNSAEQRLEVNGGFIIVKNNGADAGLMSRGGNNYRHHMIGVYPGWATYDVNLAGYNYWNSGPDYTQRIICGGSGSYLGIWASSFNAISSARFKENIQDLPYDHALDAIMHLKPRAYNMVNSQSNAIGFIVEEVLPHIPDAVKYDEKGKAESLDLYALTTVLVKAVQEQEAKIENIERQPIINYGMLLINAHTTYVPFDKSFINQLNGQVPIVTITPVGDDISIYLKEIHTDGFVVAVRDGDNKQANMSWIAVGSADVSNQQDTYQPKMSYQETTQKTLTEGEIENYRNEIRTARDKSLNEKLHTSSTTNTEKPLTYPNNQPADNEAGKGGKPPVFQESSR